MKLNIPITISIACQSISTAFMIITFILENWIVVKSTNVRYGMWKGCNSSQCYNWYSKGEEVLDYQISNSYKAFQGLQSSMLGLIVITLVSLFFNLKLCPKLLPIFIIDAILIFLATCCGLVSLIVFVTDVYKSDIHNLDWCFWLSVVALVMVFFGLIFLVAFSISIELKSSHRRNNSGINESAQVFYQNENFDSIINTPVKEQEIKSITDTENKISPRYNQNTKIAVETATNHLNDANLVSDSKPSPRFQKNTPSQTESRLKNRIDAKQIEEEKKPNKEHSKKPNRNYWNNKNNTKKYRYHHEHYEEKKPTQEQYKPGYSSEPDMIEYSLDRSWVSASNNLNTSMPILENESTDPAGTINSKRFVKLPKLIYYDGSNHYTRANP